MSDVVKLQCASDVLQAADRLAAATNSNLFLVGGGVRDLLLSTHPFGKDIDLVLEGDALRFASQFNRMCGGTLKLFSDFLTAKILKPAVYPEVVEIDIASARTEDYPYPGSLPVVRSAGLWEDLVRRDFTVNAMALRVSQYLEWIQAGSEIELLKKDVIDPFGGKRDLEELKIRVLHARSFVDDPTRIFRACRYAIRLGGTIEQGTEHLLREALEGQCMLSISAARRLGELRKICEERNPLPTLHLLAGYGGLQQALGLSSHVINKALDALADLDALSRCAKADSGFVLLFRALHRVSNTSDLEALLRAGCVPKKELKAICG